MKQVKLAEAVGVSEATISRILSGRRRPSYHIGKALAKATNSTLEIWMEGNQEQKIEALESIDNETSKFFGGKGIY